MTAQEFLLKKGITKIHQKSKFINLTIGEILEMLSEFSSIREKSIHKIIEFNTPEFIESEFKSN